MKRMMSVLLLGLLSAGWVFGQTLLEPVVVDQSGEFRISSNPPLFRSEISIGANTPVGQEFVPTLSTLNFVDFYLYSPGNSLLASTIHPLAIDARPIGRSLDVALLPSFDGVARFRFSSLPELLPGRKYVIHILLLSGNADAMVDYFGRGYSNGRGVSSASEFFPEIDLWFREGIIVPEPSTVSLVVASGALLLLLLQKRGGDSPVEQLAITRGNRLITRHLHLHRSQRKFPPLERAAQ